MYRLHRDRDKRSLRKGNVVIAVAVALVTILGFVALSLDGGKLMDVRRQAQSTADSAALAAAGELYASWFTNGSSASGLDVTGSALEAARAAASANGFVHGNDGCTVTVNIPPKSGPFKDEIGHVEVVIVSNQQLSFSQVFGSSSISYGARSVARGRRNEINNAIIVLDPSSKAALSSGGNGSVTVQGSPIQVNSNNAQAMVANGGGIVKATQFNVNGIPGWINPGGGIFDGPINWGAPPMPDPLANLPYPDPTNMVVQSLKKIVFSGNKKVTLQPGYYEGGIQINGGTVTLEPGIYYMEGGGFSLGGQGNLVGSGVMIFNNPLSNSDTISIAGSGNVQLSPASSGPYQGVSLFQNRSSTTPVSVSGSSDAIFSISGCFYAAGALLSVTGNGTQQTIGSQYISYDLALGGNGTYYCSWIADQTPGIREIRLVE